MLLLKEVLYEWVRHSTGLGKWIREMLLAVGNTYHYLNIPISQLCVWKHAPECPKAGIKLKHTTLNKNLGKDNGKNSKAV